LRNEELKKDLWHNVELRKKSEQELHELAEEVDRFKVICEEKRATDLSDQSALNAQLKDLKYANDDLYRKFVSKQDEAS
jgi:hypothetical protein